MLTCRLAAAHGRLATKVAIVAATALLATGPSVAGAVAEGRPRTPSVSTQERDLAREILREMIELRSSAAHPEVTVELLERVASRLEAAGFADDDMDLVASPGGVANLIVRYRGSGARRPILTLAHVDVVDAEPEAWQQHPYTFAEADGYYYGRGTTDNKAGAATLVANFIRLRAERFVPDRDLILLLTGDEESAMAGIDLVVNQRRELVDAELALNTDAGGGFYDANGEPQLFSVQTSEKLYQSFELEITNPGGHSARPRPDNAIYELTRALNRIAEYGFAFDLNDGTRVYLERAAAFEHGDTADLMRALAASEPVSQTVAAELAARSALFNATLRTTCVATRLQAGHADNALPRSARAVVNCRILPGYSPDEIEAELRRVVDNDSISFRRLEDAFPSPPSPWDPAVVEPIERLVAEMWPGTPVIPNMSTGATDGLWVRNVGIPVYGVSAIFEDPDDVRAHGLDERVGVDEFHDAVEFWYRLLKALSS